MILNTQQLDFLRVAAAPGSVDDLIRAALAAPHPPAPAGEDAPARAEEAGHILEPGTGKAFEVHAGQVIRVEQIAGGQCVDLNVFNLRNRHERLHVGRTRGLQGLSPATGDVLWSNAPWERPLMTIVASTTRTDTTFPFCSRLIYRELFGVRDRTNCEEIQNEAQREYGLERWEIHESLNLFMYTAPGPDGEMTILPNRSRPGDHIAFEARLDLLVVPNVCGDDLTACNNFGLRPVRVTIEEGHPRAAQEGEPLRPDPGYVPAFPHLPLRPADIHIDTDLPGDQARAMILSWALDHLPR